MIKIFKKKNCLSAKGFTLVEMIVVTAIYVLILTAVTGLVVEIQKNYRVRYAALSDEFQAIRLASRFTNELRNAYTGNDGSFALNQAGATQIIFYTSSTLGGTAKLRVRYYLSGNVLYRGVVTPTGNPLSYNLASEVVKPVQANIGNGATPVFYYYDGNYNGTGSPLTQPVNVNSVRFVKIHLMILSNPGAGQGTYSVDAGVAVRNLKTNLGN